MREIKFRIWSKKTKMMFDLGYLADCLYRQEFAEEYGNNLLEYDIMQNTGLIDSDGKEIYEGDIVETEFSKENGAKPYIVMYQAPEFVMKQNKRNKMWASFNLAPGEKQFQKVIGNIYENPDLLK